jgi:hypothetical protein
MDKGKEILEVSFALAGLVILARYTPQIQYYLNIINNASKS